MSKSSHLSIGILLLICAPAPLVLAVVRQGIVEQYTEDMIRRWIDAGLVDGARLGEFYGGNESTAPRLAVQSQYEVDFAGAGLLGLNFTIGGVIGAIGVAHLMAARRKRNAAPGV